MSDTAPERVLEAAAQAAREPATDSPEPPQSVERAVGAGGTEIEDPPASDTTPGEPPPSSAAAPSVPPPAEALALVGQVLAGRYRVEELLGSGGMGAVYRAQHVHMRKNVAVKVLHREMTYLPEVVARFEREAVAAARIEHPHVAAATDFGRIEGGAFYLVLEYVEGRSLRRLLKETHSLAPALALHITRQIAEALDAAHASEIVHRDLKPDNVMLVEKDGDPYFVKVLDFGIAKITSEVGQQLTQVGSVFGTPEYMSPEQATGAPVDARSDLYTVGIMLYEMLAGQTPFDDDDLVVVLTRQMTAEPPPLPAAVPPGVSLLVARLLSKDAATRPQTAGELIQHCDHLLATEVDQLLGLMPHGDLPMPASVAAVSGPASIAYSDTMHSIARPLVGETPNVSVATPRPPRARSGSSGLFGPLLQRVPVLAKSVSLGGQPVPVWALGLVGTVVVGLGFVLVVGALLANTGGARGAKGADNEPAAVSQPDLEALLARAEGGDREALAELQTRPETDRSAKEWRALGRGFSAIGNVKPSLDAYDKALALDASLAKDPAVVKDISAAATASGTAQLALGLAARRLGADGADLVYHLHQSSKSTDAEVHKFSKTLLEGESLRAQASPALLVALDLQKARGCQASKPVVSRAAQHADARSLAKLRSFSARRGCGFLGMSDCFSCLRVNKDLSDAIKRAESTPAPKFD
ncbi:MAG: serine/threonine protein kinase [Polyangiaceae bacterium]|nr:serine/threonine protein kinase [Polyangiaceae bacterium]